MEVAIRRSIDRKNKKKGLGPRYMGCSSHATKETNADTINNMDAT
jgi:hypothetical protein